MKVLTTTGLSKLIELSKDTFVDKTDTTQVSLVTLANVATTGSYTDLSNKPTIPIVDQTYSASSTNAQSGTAVASAVSGKQNTITGAATTITSSNLTASKALVSDSSGKVAASSVTSTELGYVHGVTSAIQTQIDSKLNKLTYEWNNAISFGSTGKLCIGKFCCYDSNITIDIDATTGRTYHCTLVMAMQNIGTSSGGSLTAVTYGDANNTVTPNLYIYKHPANDCLVEVYFSPQAWSKNIIHIRAVTLNKDHGSVSYDSVAFDLCTSVSEIPAEATIKPVNALDNKQDTLVSGTNIKTINSTSLLGSGNLTIDSLPSQSGQSGKYLTTNGTIASWANVDALPSQSGQSGKYLTTNGSAASWASIPTYTNGAGISLSNNTFSANCDTTTVSTNGSSKLQAIGVIDKKSSSAVYTWKGTKAEYDALSSYNNSWIYYITDDTTLPSETYYTKAQIDAMNKLNHTIEQDTASVILKDTNTSADVTTAPSSAHNGGLVQFKDKNGETSGYVYTRYETNGNIIQYLESNKKVSGTVYTNKIGVGVKSNGTGYTYAPKPAASASTSDNNIATVGWVNDTSISTNVVHKTGAETISGAKTFSGNNNFTGIDTFSNSTQFTGKPEFICGSSNTIPLVVMNTLDDSTDYAAEQLETNIGVVDANGVWLGGWEHYHLPDGTYRKQMSVKRQSADEYATISVSIDPDGQAYCNLPTDTYGTTFHGLSSRSMWADLAERYKTDKEYPVGTLIKFGGEKDITIADNRCNGVISDKPGYILDAELKDSQPVALVGKTPIRIIGVVDKFDKIVLDPEHPGVGRVKKQGEDLPTIARALEEVDDPNEKLVLCVTKFNLD